MRLFFQEIWPEILRRYSPDQDGTVQEAIRYALEIKQQAGLSLIDKTWMWKINAAQSFEYTEADWWNGVSWEEKKEQIL